MLRGLEYCHVRSILHRWVIWILRNEFVFII
jgi:hypothetical protein